MGRSVITGRAGHDIGQAVWLGRGPQHQDMGKGRVAVGRCGVRSHSLYPRHVDNHRLVGKEDQSDFLLGGPITRDWSKYVGNTLIVT